METTGKIWKQLYAERFGAPYRTNSSDIWRCLCTDFFQKFVPLDSIVLDIGAGACEFINNIECKKKYALDINADSLKSANADVETVVASSTDMSFFPDQSVDIIFISGFFAVLKSKNEVIKTLTECRRILKKDGKFLLMQPNYKYVGSQYWDMFDHIVPLTHEGTLEALTMTGFEVEKIIPRFMPYAFKSSLPKSPYLLKLYLKLPFVWPLFGKLMFITAHPTPF